tara:strand:- start:10470 stop:11645 length:1176 start_codon:yes stop_codon:yes gene_type:complete
VITFFANPVWAQDEIMNSYFEKLMAHPDVMQVLADAQEMKEMSTAALGLPDPVLILGVDNVPVDDPSYGRFLPTSKVIGFKQDIPNGSVREAQSDRQMELSAKQIILAEFTKNRLKSLFTSMLLKLEKVRTQQELAENQLVNYAELETYFKGRLESGDGVYWRFAQVDVERSLIEQQLNDLKSERIEIESALINLVGEVPDLKVYTVESEEWKNADDFYPVKIAHKDLEAQAQGVKVAESAYGSNYSIQAMYKNREEGANFKGDDWFSVQATFSVPLWYNSNQAPKKRAAQSKYNAVQYAYESAKRLWLKNIKSLESKRDATLKNIHLLVAKDKSFKELSDSVQRTYESGETSLDNLLTTKISRLSIQSQLAQKRYMHMSLISEINSYIGK